jgi:hypothetical protein
VFLTHGEKNAAIAFSQLLAEKRGWSCVVPRMGQSFDLE